MAFNISNIIVIVTLGEMWFLMKNNLFQDVMIVVNRVVKINERLILLPEHA